MVIFLKKPRRALLDFLEKHMNSIVEKGTSAPYWLHQAIDGLHALNDGVVKPIYTPTKTKEHGVSPSAAKKYRMMAVGFYELLRKQQYGYTPKKAYSFVRRAYGNVSVNTIKDWKKKYDKIPWLNAVRESIENSTHWTIDQVFAELATAGQVYQKSANKKKKSLKLDKQSATQKNSD